MFDINSEEQVTAAKLRFCEAILFSWWKVGGDFGRAAFEAAGELARRRGEDPLIAGLEFTTLTEKFGRGVAAALTARQEEQRRQTAERRAKAEREEEKRRRVRTA